MKIAHGESCTIVVGQTADNRGTTIANTIIMHIVYLLKTGPLVQGSLNTHLSQVDTKMKKV